MSNPEKFCTRQEALEFIIKGLVAGLQERDQGVDEVIDEEFPIGDSRRYNKIIDIQARKEIQKKMGGIREFLDYAFREYGDKIPGTELRKFVVTTIKEIDRKEAKVKKEYEKQKIFGEALRHGRRNPGQGTIN